MTTVDVNFDDLAEPEATAGTTATVSDEDQPSESEWPKYVAVSEGEVPNGCVSIPKFAELLTRDQMLAEFRANEKGETYDGPTGQVLPQSVYQATRSANPLPHVIGQVTYQEVVKQEDGTETVEEKVKERTYIPYEEARAVWSTRRRTGGVGEEIDPDKVARIAGQRQVQLADAEKRLKKQEVKVTKLRTLVQKSDDRLKDIGKTWQDAERLFSEHMAEKEKDKQIPDDEADTTSTTSTA